MGDGVQYNQGRVKVLNERLTEKIIREHFSRFVKDGVFLHEQSIPNPRINKLLKGASKSGDGKGYPDFVVEFKKEDFLIVVEAKASTRRHKSNNLDKPSEYAVDGALLYASHLVKSYDVLSIGISGTSRKEMKVTHHLHFRERSGFSEIFGNKLLPINDYLMGYLNDPQKQRQDFESLIEFTRTLNERLQSNKISESDRAILISMILIALERRSFKDSYKTETPKRIARSLVDTAIAQLSDAEIPPDRLETLRQVFNFLPVEKKILEKNDELANIIQSVDEHVNNYFKNHKYIDILGGLYTEFLRYANSDKGLGIVLTPPHVADFFAELAQVNKDSVVYDNCTGTGGFLIHAMGKMIEDTKGDSKLERRIKSRQLYGIEEKPNIYPLAVSNMYIHQDGKTNIFHGNCFDTQIVKLIKRKTPNIGFLNPPYKSSKGSKGDVEEIEFVLNNLECLQHGGTCVCIIPMQCVLSTDSMSIELKSRLLAHHTLEAVFSMPDQLFHNSKTNVITCVMVITAHKPHPRNKETYLGYCKDDGFTLSKKTGRADNHGKWRSIKEKWVKCYINRQEVFGFSVNKMLKADDEWCAESYLEADWSLLTVNRFAGVVKNFIKYKMDDPNLNKNNNLDFISKPLVERREEFNVKKWKRFSLNEIFTINLGAHTDKKEVKEGAVPYITRTAENNGVQSYGSVEDLNGRKIQKGDAITIGAEGYTAFYQPNDFLTGNKITILRNNHMNSQSAMFICCVLNATMKGRYNYGYAATMGRLQKLEILLPADPMGEPDWHFMERYIKSLPYSSNL